MGILKNMIEESKNNIRFEKDGLIFYNPTKEQDKAFKDALKEIMTVQGVDPGIESVRFLIENSSVCKSLIVSIKYSLLYPAPNKLKSVTVAFESCCNVGKA